MAKQDKQHSLCWISLGCPKNLVDTERTLGRLVERGWLLCEAPEDADIIVINTCGFIGDAVDESIDVLRQAAALKKEGCLGVIAAGCLVERLGNTLSADVPEVDAFVGIADADEIEEAARAILQGKGRLYTRKPHALHKDTARLRVTPRHYAYLQITDGCNNCCSYCVIPNIRGSLRSKPLRDIIEEAAELREDGVAELNLIGQDITSYGRDLAGDDNLVTVLKEVSKFDFTWIRLLYTHPAHYTDELIEEIANNDKIVKYIDLPIQHINDDVLKRMNRLVGRRDIESLIERLRQRIPGVVIRTSLIVGLPGETPEAFEELVDFVRQTRFERLGTFAYSREEGVPAADFPDQVDGEVKAERFDRIMKLQREIAAEYAASQLGKILDVVVERQASKKRNLWEGRTAFDAPEVDGIIYLKGKNMEPGMFAKAKVTGTREYDLEGEIIE